MFGKPSPMLKLVSERELEREDGMKRERKTKKNERGSLPPLTLPFLYDQGKELQGYWTLGIMSCINTNSEEALTSNGWGLSAPCRVVLVCTTPSCIPTICKEVLTGDGQRLSRPHPTTTPFLVKATPKDELRLVVRS